MRRRTALAIAAVVGILGGTILLGVLLGSGGTLTEQWVSDTARDNERNHHAVATSPDGDVIVAPVAAVPGGDSELTDESCALVRLAPGNGSTMWRIGVDPADCFTHALTQPTIEDVDGDGRHEVLVASTEESLVSYSAADGERLWDVPLSTYGYGRPTVANVTAAPGREVVASDIRGGVVVAHANGTVAWRFDLNATTDTKPIVWERPHVDDINADGSPEVVVGTKAGPVVLSSSGSVVWQRDGDASYLTAAQTDGDAGVELITAGTNKIRAYEGKSGDVAWERELSGAKLRTASDADADGTVELFAGLPDGRFVALDAESGRTEWSTNASNDGDSVVPPPVLGDVDGDGDPVVVGALNTGTVVLLEPESGEVLARYERNVPVWTFPTVQDIDSDGRAEILVTYGDGRIVSLSYGDELVAF